jgi:hypothetical protein
MAKPGLVPAHFDYELGVIAGPDQGEGIVSDGVVINAWIDTIDRQYNWINLYRMAGSSRGARFDHEITGHWERKDSRLAPGPANDLRELSFTDRLAGEGAAGSPAP